MISKSGGSRRQHQQQQKGANKAIIYNKLDTSAATANDVSLIQIQAGEWPQSVSAESECEKSRELSSDRGAPIGSSSSSSSSDQTRGLTLPVQRQPVATSEDYLNFIDSQQGDARLHRSVPRSSDWRAAKEHKVAAFAAAFAPADQLNKQTGGGSGISHLARLRVSPAEWIAEQSRRANEEVAKDLQHARSSIREEEEGKADDEEEYEIDAADCAQSNAEQETRAVPKLCQRPVAIERLQKRSELLPVQHCSNHNQEVSLAALDYCVEPNPVPFDERKFECQKELAPQELERHHQRQQIHNQRHLQQRQQQQQQQQEQPSQCADIDYTPEDNGAAEIGLQSAGPELERQQQQQHVIIDSNSTFWRRLSNLSRSITQRNNSNLPVLSSALQQDQLLQSTITHLSTMTTGGEQNLRQFAELDNEYSIQNNNNENEENNNNNNQLAPEVVGYLAKLKLRQQTCKNTRPELAGDFDKRDKAHQSSAAATAMTASGANAEPTGSAHLEQSATGSGSKRNQRESNTGDNEERRLIKIVELPTTPSTTKSLLTTQEDQVESLGHEQTLEDQSQQFQLNLRDQFDNTQQQQHHHQRQQGAKGSTAHHQVKLSITTTNTTTTTNNTTTNTTHSSASSLSSCILSESTVTSEVRLKWGKKMDFLLSIIGFAVDLANIWRFPYLVYKNGGGVFLIPYLTMLIFGGIPLFFLELCLGQYVKKGPITVWNKIFPYFKGVGYCSILISWYVSFYYNVLIAWSVYFIYRSISSIGGKMPWEDCDNSWNSQGGTCVSISHLKSVCSVRNETLEMCRRNMFSNVSVTSPASEFFIKELSQIDQSKGLDDMGYLRPELVVCLFIVYLLHYCSLFRGLETSGKVVWVTATAPYMILSILLVRGLFLPGAAMGIEYYLSPKLEKLADSRVWIDAAGQVFYSIGVGFGVHLTYASFNSHDNNCYRDCLMTSAVNALTSVYSGLVVFVYLGYMATNLGIEIDKVASEGYSLVFEVYPEALTTLPFARFWSILFFIMLLTLGIDSAMGGLEAVITGLEDEFKFAKRLSRGQLTGLVIVSSFLPALISCTQGGAYTLFWFDIYSAGVSLLFSALFETIGVVYCYGLDKFILNIESMLGRRPHLFYILCWKYISPLFLIGIIYMYITDAERPKYRGYLFPTWSIVLGWCLAFSSVAAIPIVALLTWLRRTTNRPALNSPTKSPRKLRATSGADSVTSGARKSPAHHQYNHQQHQKQSGQCKTHSDCNQITLATAIITSSPGEHPHRHFMKGMRLHDQGDGKNREHML